MRRGVRAIILNFLVVIVESSSETSHRAFNSSNNGRTVLYRSQIDDLDAEISHYYHLRGGGGGRTHAQNTSWKVVPFGEISVYRSDPRHVAKLMSRSDGLDVVSTARKRRGGEF